MPQIRPISDLRNKFTEISETLHQTKKPIFLTKNGVGDMVVMSHEAYEQLLHQLEVRSKILDAEQDLQNGDVPTDFTAFVSDLTAGKYDATDSSLN